MNTNLLCSPLNYDRVKYLTCSTAWKVPKYGPEKAPHLDTFHAVASKFSQQQSQIPNTLFTLRSTTVRSKTWKFRKLQKKQLRKGIKNTANKNKERETQKWNLIKFEKKKLENTDFPWYLGFRFEPYTKKRKLGNHGNPTKTLQITLKKLK